MWCNYIYSMEVVFANGGDQSTTPRTTAKAITSDISAVEVHDYYYKILSRGHGRNSLNVTPRHVLLADHFSQFLP